MTQAYRDQKLAEARSLLKQHDLLNARGELRRPTRTTAAARRRLTELLADATAERRERLARLTAEVPAAGPGSIGLRLDPQGRARLIAWETGPVVVRPAREVTA